MILYLAKGELPWMGLPAKNKEDKYKQIMQKKRDISINELCKGLPIEFEKYFNYARNLKFEKGPNIPEQR